MLKAELIATNSVLPRSGRNQGNTLRTLSILVLCLGAIVMLIPFMWALSTSFKTVGNTFILPPQWIPHPWHFADYVQIWSQEPFGHGFLNTMIIEVTVLTIGLTVSALAAFAFSKLEFPFKETIFIGLLSTMMIPYTVIMIPQFIGFAHIHWTNTLLPLIVPGLFGNIVVIFFFRQFMQSSIPNDLIDAAKIDGCGIIRIFTVVVVPIAKPAIAAQAALGFMGIWNDFLGPLIYLSSPQRQTLQVMIANLQAVHISGSDYPMIMTASMIAMVPMIVIFLFFQRYFIESLAISGLKG